MDQPVPPDIPREIEGEVTRIEAVRYLQGALGHALGSLLFLLVAGVFWYSGRAALAWSAVVAASLVSANGLSIWAWDRLREYFTPAAGDDGGPSRTLVAQPLSGESRVELKAGAVSVSAFVGLLLLGYLGLALVGARAVGGAVVVGLAVGNLVALVRALRADL